MRNYAAAIYRKTRKSINFERRRIEYSERVLLNQGCILSNQQVNKSEI